MEDASVTSHAGKLQTISVVSEQKFQNLVIFMPVQKQMMMHIFFAEMKQKL